MEKRKPTEVSHVESGSIVSELAQKAISAGYRVVPIKDGFPTGRFGSGQTYNDLSASEWRNATAVGLVLDQAVLIDYDGNKADEEGDWIIPVDELPRLLGVDIMPTPVQVGSQGRSLHYLFRLPDGVTAGVDTKQSADGKLTDHLDIKCGNQLMHIKVGKDLGDLKPVSQLPVVPNKVVEVLQSRGGDGSYDDAMSSLMRGQSVHHSTRTIINRLLAQGKSDIEIWSVFAGLRQALEMVRGKERIDLLFNRGIPDLIKSGLEKYPPAPVPFVEEPVEESVWDDWVYVAHEHKFYSRSKRESFKPEAFNSLLALENTMVNGKPKKPADFALGVVGVPKVAFAMYAPAFGEFFTYKGSTCFNTYKEGFVPATASTWSDIYQKHVELLFPNDHKVITQWMAYVVRNAGRKVLWSPLLKGIEGDGKTAIGNMIIAALGQENAHQIDMDSIRSSFNAWAEGACFGIIEEVRVSGQNRHMVMDKLKPLITNTEISITRKGQNPFTALNTMNYLLLTNHEDALALSETDRRYGVFFTQFESREQLPSVKDHYEPLWDAIRTRPDAIRGWLMSIDLSDFDPNKAPETTEAKRKMMVNSRSEATALLAEVLELGGLGVHPETFNPTAVNILIEEYRLGRPINNRQLPKAAEELGFVQWPKLKWEGRACRAYVKKGSGTVTSNDDVRALWSDKHGFEPENS